MDEASEKVPGLSPREVRDRLGEGCSLALLDVRTESERDHVHLEDDLWVPMDQVSGRLEEIRDLPRPLVVYCHHGMRSQRVARALADRGIEDVYNLSGGIDAWARQVDPDMPRY